MFQKYAARTCIFAFVLTSSTIVSLIPCFSVHPILCCSSFVDSFRCCGCVLSQWIQCCINKNERLMNQCSWVWAHKTELKLQSDCNKVNSERLIYNYHTNAACHLVSSSIWKHFIGKWVGVAAVCGQPSASIKCLFMSYTRALYHVYAETSNIHWMY